MYYTPVTARLPVITKLHSDIFLDIKDQKCAYVIIHNLNIIEVAIYLCMYVCIACVR